MISTWSEWKRYPRPDRGENIVAPIGPGLYEVRYAGTGALHSFEGVGNVAQALALLQVGSRSWFGVAGEPHCLNSNTAPARRTPRRMPRPPRNA